MSNQGVTATLVVQYSDQTAQDNVIVAEIDPEKHSGTSFIPGEEVYFRVFANCTYEMLLSDSDASAALSGSGSDTIEEDVSFVQTKTNSIQKPYQSGWSFNWHGTNPYPAPVAPAVNMRTINLVTTVDESVIVAMGKLSYVANYKQYKLVPGASVDGYAVTILIKEVVS